MLAVPKAIGSANRLPPESTRQLPPGGAGDRAGRLVEGWGERSGHRSHRSHLPLSRPLRAWPGPGRVPPLSP